MIELRKFFDEDVKDSFEITNTQALNKDTLTVNQPRLEPYKSQSLWRKQN
jgi:hypothetical protein